MAGPAASILRPARATDHDAIADVWHAGASLPDVGPASMPTRADLRDRLVPEFAAGWNVTVAVQAEDVVGFVAIRPEDAILAELFVRPGSLGGGIGKALLDHAKVAMPDGFTLYTRSANAGARRFYEREGLAFLRHGVHPRTGDPVSHYAWNPR